METEMNANSKWNPSGEVTLLGYILAYLALGALMVAVWREM